VSERRPRMLRDYQKRAERLALHIATKHATASERRNLRESLYLELVMAYNHGHGLSGVEQELPEPGSVLHAELLGESAPGEGSS